MMAGNPSRWMHAPPNSPFVFGSSSSAAVSSSSFPDNYHQEQLPPHQSWSQLLMGRLSGGEEEDHIHSFVQGKTLENWEDHQILNLNPFHYSRLLLQPSSPVVVGSDVKQEVALTNNLCLYNEEILRPNNNCWSQQQVLAAVSSPRSCVTSNILDFSYNNKPNNATTQHHLDQSSECNSTATGGVSKKPRVQPSSSQPPLKVRKEKLGDRITALHQLVSPFGKTDTASVLLEAIGYIRFLQSQIEALSLPYLGATPSSNLRNQQFVQGERNCVFPEDPGQLLNDICQKRKGGPNQDGQDRPKDLRSRGLCLVPVSCTQHVGSDNGADYWAPAIGGGF